MSGTELTETGMSAMARELYRQASGGQPWEQAEAAVQQKMRAVVDDMIERAGEAERQPATTRGT